MSGLLIDNISMRFDLPNGGSVQALKNVTLDIKSGELLSVLGPSGCGKTTLLNIVAGFLAPTEGQVVVNDHAVEGPGPERGMVFQQGALFEWMTVRENVSFGPDMKKMPRQDSMKIVDRLLEVVGLQDFKDKAVYELSGGMQQRVGIARALANYPRVLLMDEPFGALDAQTRLMMQESLLSIWSEFGITVLFVTHDVDEAIFLADRILIMSASPGSVIADLKVGLERPRLPEMATAPEAVELKKKCLASIRAQSLKAFEEVRR